MDTYKLVLGTVSTPLDNLLQPVRHALHHVAQNLAGYWLLQKLVFYPIKPEGPLYLAPLTPGA